MDPEDRPLTTEQVSELINTPASTLRYWRQRGLGPKSFTMGPRKVMYRHSDVEAWYREQYEAERP